MFLMSVTPLFHLMGGGNNHLGTTYCQRTSTLIFATIGVVHHRFLKFSIINSDASSIPSIRSYWALNEVINVCHISLIDSIGGRLFAENTLIHLTIQMLHMIMGASNNHRSPVFCFCKWLVLRDQSNRSILPSVHCFACVIKFLHIIIKTSMSPFEGKWARAMA